MNPYIKGRPFRVQDKIGSGLPSAEHSRAKSSFFSTIEVLGDV